MTPVWRQLLTGEQRREAPRVWRNGVVGSGSAPRAARSRFHKNSTGRKGDVEYEPWRDREKKGSGCDEPREKEMER